MTKPFDPKDSDHEKVVHMEFTDSKKLDEKNAAKSRAYGQKCLSEQSYPKKSKNDPIESGYKQICLGALANKLRDFKKAIIGLLKDQIKIRIQPSDAKRIEQKCKFELKDFLDTKKEEWNHVLQELLNKVGVVAALRDDYGLSRDPKPDKMQSRFNRAFSFIVLETAITAFLSISGGVSLFNSIGSAIGISLINVILFGYVVCAEALPRSRKINSHKFWPLWLALGTILSVFTLSVNALLAHYRSEGGNFNKAVEAFLNNPIGFSTMQGYYMFGFGLLVALGAALHFYSGRDPIFAYGEAGENEKIAHEKLDEFVEEARRKLAIIRQGFDNEIDVLERNGGDSLIASELIKLSARDQQEACEDEMLGINNHFCGADILHRERMRRMWSNSNIPTYYSTDPNFLPENMAEVELKEDKFDQTITAHRDANTDLTIACEGAREKLEKDAQKILGIFKKDFVYEVSHKDKTKTVTGDG